MTVRTDEERDLDPRAVSARTLDLPSIPAVALQALQATKATNASGRQIQAVIARDQALSARILRIVNSAKYGLKGEVATIAHAVAILGMDTLRCILMAAAAQQVLQAGVARGQDLTAKLLSDHSWGAAIASRIISRGIRFENHEEAFLCGLMHDMGKLVLQKNFPERYLNIISEAYRGAASFHEAEMQLFGFSHEEVGSLLAQKWNFPPQLCTAIGYHHNPASAPNHQRLASIISLADSAMIRLEVGIRKNRNLELAKEPAADSLKLDKSALDELLLEIQASLTKMPC